MTVSAFPQTARQIFHLAWPVFISQLAVMANSIIDTVMAGRLGAVELAGVGIGASIALTVLVTFSGVLLALTPMISHHHGAGRAPAVGEEVRQTIWIALGLAIVAILLLRHPQPFLWMTEMTPEVAERAQAYLNAVSWGVPGLMLFRVFSGLSTGIGHPRAVMRFNLMGLFVKVPLNLLLMPHFGGAGCAMATSAVNTVNALLAWRWCAREAVYREYQVFARFSRPRWQALREFLKLGLPIGATFLVDVTAFTFMSLFISRYGAATSGAHQIAANLATVIFMLPLSMGNAASVLAGRALGAGDPHAARQAGLTCLQLALGLGVAVSAVLWLAAPVIARAYTTDDAVYPIAVNLIGWVAIYHLADAVQAAVVNVLRGFKRSTIPMLIYAVALWGIGLGGGYYLGVMRGEGVDGFWLAAVASLTVAAMLVTAYFLRVVHQAAHQVPNVHHGA